MDETHLYFISFLSVFISLIFTCKLFVHKKLKNLPPGPPSLPIIGHLHLIKSSVHRVFQTFSVEYGPVISLRFGSRPVLVVTSPSAVEECFTKNDVILSNRPVLPSGKYLDYNQTTLFSAPYGHLWRDLRRITTLELFSSTRLKAYMRVREDEVKSFIKDLFHVCSQDSVKVEMKSRIQGLSFNIIMRIIANKRFYGTDVEDFEEASKFKDVIRGVFEISGTSNPGDFIPVLQWIDFQGFDKKFKRLQIKSDNFSQSLIDECKRKRCDSCLDEGKPKTFIDAMLSLQELEPEYYTDDIIKGNILEARRLVAFHHLLRLNFMVYYHVSSNQHHQFYSSN